MDHERRHIDGPHYDARQLGAAQLPLVIIAVGSGRTDCRIKGRRVVVSRLTPNAWMRSVPTNTISRLNAGVLYLPPTLSISGVLIHNAS